MNTETVVNLPNENVLDDAALVPVEPQTDPVSDLSEITQEADQAAPAKEPGWIKQRVDKAVQKAIRETEERMSQQFESTLAPIRESMMERQAEQLVASGEFKTKEIALEYVRLKGGNVSVAAPEQQTQAAPRDAQGRFAPRQQQSEDSRNAMADARADLLAKQADKIKARTGVDVMALFQQDQNVKQRILSGEWDFYDVAEAVGKQRGSVPMPIRSANGAAIGPTTIAEMTDAQFAKLQENLAAGKVYQG